MKAISSILAVLVSVFAVFAAPANGVIEPAKLSLTPNGDSVVVLVPIDWGQYSAGEARWRINRTDNWFVWAAFDKDNDYSVVAGKDVSVLVEGVVTADGNHIRASFPKLEGYKGHIVWSAYQAQEQGNVSIWVNCGYRNKAGIPADRYGYKSSDEKTMFYHANL